MTQWDRALKRSLDLTVAIVGIALTWWLLIVLFVAASIDTRRCGLFSQIRIGRHGRPFRILKLRTMTEMQSVQTTVTSKNDPRITRFGWLLRRSKLDELPQLLNLLVGQMSLVGPRPDVPGFADRLTEEDRIVLSVRPGITGPATLRFRHEECLLAEHDDPERLNREVIFPEKVKLNRLYVEDYSFRKDIRYIIQTMFSRDVPKETRRGATR